MYTAEIGQSILEIFRKKMTRKALSAKELFDEYFFPLFFDNERYLMVANNSKFDQAYKQKKKKPLTAEVRKIALDDFHEAVNGIERFEAHLFMGGHSRNMSDSTASQITDMTIPISEETTYLSWLGMATGIGVKGGFSIQINETLILEQLIEGWTVYRQFMTSNPSLKPHQIDTWNGWWLFHRNSTGFQKGNPLGSFPPTAVDTKNGVGALVTIEWSKLLFSVARMENVPGKLLGYVYSFGQTNSTIGFIPLLLDQINSLPKLYATLFGDGNLNLQRQFRTLYETDMGFITACRYGAIGIKVLEPKDFRKYKNQREGSKKSLSFKKENDTINFNFHQTWIIAMLDNKQLLVKANELASSLHQIDPSSRGKKGLSNAVQQVLDAYGQKQFVSALTEMMKENEFAEKAKFDLKILDDIVAEIMNMPAAHIPLFLTLVRFKYQFIQLQNQ